MCHYSQARHEMAPVSPLNNHDNPDQDHVLRLLTTAAHITSTQDLPFRTFLNLFRSHILNVWSRSSSEASLMSGRIMMTNYSIKVLAVTFL